MVEQPEAEVQALEASGVGRRRGRYDGRRLRGKTHKVWSCTALEVQIQGLQPQELEVKRAKGLEA